MEMKDTHCDELPTILNQHKKIFKLADAVVEIASDRDPTKAVALKSALDSFGDFLKEHLEFEDRYFYQEMLKNLDEVGRDQVGFKQFINEMMLIADLVVSFLDRYQTIESIERDTHRFSRDFGRVFGVLILRIETEETSEYFKECEVILRKKGKWTGE